MTPRDECCATRCSACGRSWCREEETSPGDPDDICPTCVPLEDDGAVAP